MWKQQQWTVRVVCQSWKLWMQRALNNATSSYFIKVWCSVHWLQTRPHNNGTDKSAKGGQSAEWGNASHTENHQGHTHWDHEVHARPPTSANQTEWSRSSILQCRRKSPQPTPWSRERRNRMQTGTEQILDGSNRGLNTVSMPAEWAQADPEWERFPNRFWRLYETLLPKTWESIVKKGQQEKQSDQDANTKRFKRTLIYLDMDTQYPHFRGNFLYQATKRHLNNK